MSHPNFLIFCVDQMTAARGRVEPALVSLRDFAPTILNQAGLSLDVLKSASHVVGRDLPWLDGQSLA
jgi:arylsulfatase A-like enzyme